MSTHTTHTHTEPWHDAVVGERVATAPHTHVWLAGYRYGTVTDARAFTVTVVLERLDTRRTVQMSKRDVMPVPTESFADMVARIHAAKR